MKKVQLVLCLVNFVLLYVYNSYISQLLKHHSVIDIIFPVIVSIVSILVNDYIQNKK